MYNTAEQLDKEKLIRDDQFLDDASEFLRQRTGNLYIDSEEIFENYLTHMRYHSSNDITPVRDLMFAQKANPEMKDKMARLFQTFDKLEPNANDDLLEIATDYGISVLSSPSTWLGFLTAGAGKVASLGAQQAARTGVRALLYQGIAKAPITSGALAGAAVEGTAGFGQEKARQMARVETGAQEEEDKFALGATTVIAGALGGVGGGLTGVLKKRQVAKASKLLDDANEATREATEAATARAEQTIADNANAEAGVKARLRPLDEEAVAEGKELREQLSANELFIFDMDVPTKKAITAAAIDLVGPEDLARDPQKRITEIVADRIRSGDLTTSQIDDIAEKYNLSREQLSLIFTADVSDAARTLQLQGQLKKGVLKKLANDVEKLSDEVVDAEGNVIRRGVELSEQQGEFIADIANGMGFLATEVIGGVKGFERMRRAILTSQPQTTIRNFAGGAARILIDMPETLIENVTRKILNVFGAKYAGDSFRSDSLSILKYLAPISPTKENRVVADVIANLYESRNPEAAQRLFGTFIDSAYVANKGKTGGFLEGVGGALNFANRFADNYYKKAIFAGELNRYVKGATINGKTGRDLIQVISDGDFSKIDSKLFNKATDKSFELLYQKYPTGKGIAGKAARLYLEADKQAGSGILLGTLIPFPRFVANQIEFIYDHAPIIGMLSSKSAPEKIAKQITGMGMIMGAYGMRVANGEENMWYEYENEDGSVTDLRPFLGPLSMPFYMADLLYRHYDSGKTNTDNVNAIVKAADAKVVSEIMLGSALRVGAGAYFAETALPEMVDWAAGVGEDSDFVSSQKFERAMARFAGDYVATFSYAMPLAVARDLYKITDAEARLVNETNGQVTFGDIFTVRASRALPQPLKEKQLEGLEKKPIVKDRFVITSDERTETRDPATTALTGLARSRPKTELEKELTRNGLTAYDLYKPIPFGPADVLVRRELSGNGRMPSLSEYIKPLLRSRQYSESDKKTKKVLLKNISKGYVSEVRSQVFDVLLTQARNKKIDYSVEEVSRIKFESEPIDSRDMAVVEFRNLKGRKPDLKKEEDLKLLIEISKQFVKQFSIGGLVTDEAPQQFNRGGAVGTTRSGQKIYDKDVDETAKQMVELGLDLAPVTGEIRSAQAAVEDFEKGNYGMAALGALGALPGVGMVARAGTKGVKALSKYADELWDTPTQKISSADTSINEKKLPAGYSKLKKLDVFKPGQRVVDIGGGRFDNAIEDLAKQDVELHVYDPFNRTPEHNRSVKELVADGGADVAVSNNTLNVIQEPENIKRVVQQAENAIKPGDKAYFTVYVGDKSGKGKQTSKGWQRNEPTSAYVSRVEEVFGKGNVTFKGDLITATKADAIEPKKFGPEDLDMIPDRVFYHGTMSDIAEFDPDLVDIGVHLGGNPTQSSDRLKDLSDPYTNLPRGAVDFKEGSNIIPLRARMQNTLEMEDVGDWKNSYEVAYKLSRHPKFRNNRTVQDIMEEADAEQAFRTDPSSEPFRDSMENRALLDELRNLIQEKGYDSIRYINAVEGKSQLSKQGENLRKEVLDKMDVIQDRILKRAEADPDWQVPKPEDYPDAQALEAAIQKWSYERPDVMSYATKEERLDLADLAIGKKKVEDKYGNDPYSYIVLDPSQLRSALSAKFDPAARESANLNMNRGGLMSRK